MLSLKSLVLNSNEWVLLSFKDNRLVLNHLFLYINISFITILRCLSLVLVTIILISSTRKMILASLVAPLGKSLIARRKSEGPRMDPCGTPLLTSFQLENETLLLAIVLSISTLWNLFEIWFYQQMKCPKNPIKF